MVLKMNDRRVDQWRLQKHELMQKVKDLYETGEYTDQQLMKTLNISRPLLHRIYTDLGVPTRYARKGENKPQYTAEMDKIILSMFDEGAVNKDVYAALKMQPCKEYDIFRRYEKLCALREKARNKPEKITCMRCHTPFISWDKKKNRHCNTCLKHMESLSYVMAA